MSFVLHASVALAWAFEDEAGDVSDAALERLARESSLVPSHWSLEVANGLLVAQRRGRLTEGDGQRFVELLIALPVDVDSPTTRRVFSEVLLLAREHRLSSYDAAYLELAMRSALPLASLDRDLREAATQAGVPLLG